MVQKEVAERICTKPGDMSLLAISIQYYGKPKIVDIVKRGNFWPEPGVDSAILHIDLAKPLSFPPLVGEGRVGSQEFFRVAKAGFASKRKQLWKNLSVGLKLPGDKVKGVLTEVTGNDKIRAEDLSVENWVKIVEKLTPTP
jgi:16S rRNA (adenine1518-N6/adenine1519-N6)-dimethyltransferase